MTKVYLASPFFNDRETRKVIRAERILGNKGLTVFSPRLSNLNSVPLEQVGTHGWSIDIFNDDVKHMRWCDIAVVLYHGNYSDSGTAMEIGWLYAMGKPIILVHIGEDSNLMCHEAAHANLKGLGELVNYDFDTMPTNYYEGKMF